MEIVKIYWERTYINIEFKSNKECDMFLESDDKKIYFNILKIRDDMYKASLNITIAENANMLQPKKYKISSSDIIFYENKLLLELENFSRVFEYNKIYAYICSFSLRNDNGKIQLYMRASYMMVNDNPKKIRFRKENKKFKNAIKNIGVQIIFYLINKIYFITYYIYHLFKTKKSILFMSENKVKMSENLQAINNRLEERNLSEKYIIRHSYRNIFDKKYPAMSWIKMINKICKSDYIFIDDYTPIFKYLNLNKKQILVQTWHAGCGFKLVGYARFGRAGSPHPYYCSHKKYTYGLVGCEALKEIYSDVWGISKDKLIPSGMPRLDHFLDKELIKKSKEEIYTQYPKLLNKKIILYAPTYRGVNHQKAYFDYSCVDFDKLYELCNKEDCIVVFKQHHFIKDNVPIPNEYEDRIIEIKDIDINKLFYISDILITDYSSCIYDFALLNKPMIFYAYDRYIYCATRGVHGNIEDIAPGKVCENFDQVLEAIYNKDFEMEKIKNFYVDNNINGTMASDIVINKVLLGLNDI